MGLVSTPAIVLQSFAYGETSKIVRLATPHHGVLSAIAKGAHRSKSRFGARLQAMSAGTAQLYVKVHRDLHTLAEFDVERSRANLAHHMERYVSAVALAELVLRFAPEEPHPEIYALLEGWLDRMTDEPPLQMAATSLTAMWSVIAAMGFMPALDGCAVDGRPLGDDGAAFSVRDGGLVCPACATSRDTASLEATDRAALLVMIHGHPADPCVPLSSRHAASHRRLLGRFVRQHLAEQRQLHALDFWEGLSWATTS